MRIWPRSATEKQGGGRTIDRDLFFTLDRDDGGTRPISVVLRNAKRGSGVATRL
jgi:hypothetical protein